MLHALVVAFALFGSGVSSGSIYWVSICHGEGAQHGSAGIDGPGWYGPHRTTEAAAALDAERHNEQFAGHDAKTFGVVSSTR